MTARKTRSTRTQKKTDTGSGLLSPPSSNGDKTGDRDTAGPSSAMISPPPEEDEGHGSKARSSAVFVELPPPKSTSKRKRLASASSLLNLAGEPNTTTTGEPPTPNPKARKQSRRSKSPLSSDEDSNSPIHDSPTKNATSKSPQPSNPQADYIPPELSYARHVLTARNRRSITPIPPYEPPTDRFTPPREIIVQPSSAQKKKPRQSKKKTGKQLKLQIKEEPPEIDLNGAIPPPSPTDDPLLLRGPSRSSRARSLPKQSRGTSPIPRPEPHEKTPPPPDELSTLPTSSPWSEVDLNNADFPPMPSTSDSMTPDAPEEPVWQEGPSGWTESSDNEEPTFDQEGEYTGKFASYVVPTKPDPPTTVQRERQEAWGRPISPFPYPTDRKSRWSSPLTPAETQEDPQVETQELEREPEEQPALEVADLTMTPHDIEGEELFGSDKNTAQEGTSASPNAAAIRQVLIPATVQPMFNFDGLSSPDHSYETPIRPPKEKPVPFITFFPRKSSTAGSSKTPKTQFPPPQRSFIFNSPARNVADLERDEESFVDRALSEAPEDDEEDKNAIELSQRVPHLQQLDAPEGDTEEDDEEAIDLGVIKISSEDPMAAAKAAAILKFHDYDLVKRAHRRKLLGSGISKTSPRKRSVGGPGKDTFVRPISPVAMPELIREAESELEKSFNGSERFMTPIRANPSEASSSNSRYVDPSQLFDPTGPREWGKNDWKILDACFTDERLDAAEKMGMAEGSLADVTDIRLDDVVNRFVEVIGGDAVLAVLGPSWMRKDILKRARALERKQRMGKGAPGTPRRSQTPFSEASGHIEVPDFTPIGPRRVADRLDEGSLRLPATLLAPRYSHLMDEAVAISRGGGGEPPASSSGVTVKAPPDSPSLFRRLTSPLFSYLPLLSKGTSEELSKDVDKSGLPLPPPELFEKERDPIVTPAPKVPQKLTHPKDQVELHAVSPKLSMIPKPKIQPKRLVELRPAPPVPEPVPVAKSVASDRRQSGGSVKDLVKSFETLDESVSSLKSSTGSVQNINDWRNNSLGVSSRSEGSGKPQWKP